MSERINITFAMHMGKGITPTKEDKMVGYCCICDKPVWGFNKSYNVDKGVFVRQPKAGKYVDYRCVKSLTDGFEKSFEKGAKEYERTKNQN